jgi:hypothetical protein
MSMQLASVDVTAANRGDRFLPPWGDVRKEGNSRNLALDFGLPQPVAAFVPALPAFSQDKGCRKFMKEGCRLVMKGKFDTRAHLYKKYNCCSPNVSSRFLSPARVEIDHCFPNEPDRYFQYSQCRGNTPLSRMVVLVGVVVR